MTSTDEYRATRLHDSIPWATHGPHSPPEESSMTPTPQALFERVRPLLNGPKNSDTWNDLLDLLDVDTADSPEFRNKFEPAIREALDHYWDDLLRVVGKTHTTRQRRWGVIYHVQGNRGQLGVKRVRELKKDMARGVVEGHYRGLSFADIERKITTKLELLATSPYLGALEHLFVNKVSLGYDDFPVETCQRFIEAIHKHSDGQLESFGGHLTGWSPSPVEFWAKFGEATDRFQRLETLLVPWEIGNFTPIDISWVSNLQLRRLKILGEIEGVNCDVLQKTLTPNKLGALEVCSFELSGYVDENDLIDWIDSRSDLNVQRWCVGRYQDKHGDIEYPNLLSFDEQQAISWQHKLGNADMFPYEASALEVEDIGEKALDTFLLDENGELKPSEQILAFSAVNVSETATRALIEQIPTRWPNLRSLYLDSAGPSRPLYDLLQDDRRLLDQLDYFDTNNLDVWMYYEAVYDISHSQKSAKAYKDAVSPIVEDIFGECAEPYFGYQLDTYSNYRLMVSITHCTTTVARMTSLAQLMGMQRLPGEPRDALRQRILDETLTRLAPDGLSPSPFIERSPAWASNDCTRAALTTRSTEHSTFSWG